MAVLPGSIQDFYIGVSITNYETKGYIGISFWSATDNLNAIDLYEIVGNMYHLSQTGVQSTLSMRSMLILGGLGACPQKNFKTYIHSSTGYIPLAAEVRKEFLKKY